jgi:glucokinase
MTTHVLGGIDIGGTKCAVTLGRVAGEGVEIIAKRRFPTPPTPAAALDQLAAALRELVAEHGAALAAIGVSCGGPLDSRRGLVLSPPNLPGWDGIAVTDFFADAFGVPVSLQNDANAGALAEWLWGAGRGCDNVVFLTFGTGMGAGLILDGRLYSGTNDMAGEVGHMRLAADGPVGYGKAGSFEGFCSGGGIARMAQARAREALAAGNPPRFCPTPADVDAISAASVADAAQHGDPLALAIWETVAQRLGQGLALLIDVLNPQRIILGSIYLRQRALLEPAMRAVIEREALAYSARVCEIVPAGLGESIGDFAALALAYYVIRPQATGAG